MLKSFLPFLILLSSVNWNHCYISHPSYVFLSLPSLLLFYTFTLLSFFFLTSFLPSFPFFPIPSLFILFPSFYIIIFLSPFFISSLPISSLPHPLHPYSSVTILSSFLYLSPSSCLPFIMITTFNFSSLPSFLPAFPCPILPCGNDGAEHTIGWRLRKIITRHVATKPIVDTKVEVEEGGGTGKTSADAVL